MLLNVDDLIGLDVQEAKNIIFKKGLRYRVIHQDGTDFVNKTNDKRDDRINLKVGSGVILEATIG